MNTKTPEQLTEELLAKFSPLKSMSEYKRLKIQLIGDFLTALEAYYKPPVPKEVESATERVKVIYEDITNAWRGRVGLAEDLDALQTLINHARGGGLERISEEQLKKTIDTWRLCIATARPGAPDYEILRKIILKKFGTPKIPSEIGNLAKAVLDWWKQHEFDECGDPQDPRNVYSEEPEMVKEARRVHNLLTQGG